MFKRTLFICLIGVIISSLIPYSLVLNGDNRANGLQVRNGVMDLAGWDYERDKQIPLDGEWEFYWGQLLSPGQFDQNTGKLEPTAFMKVPSQWNGKMIDGKTLPAHGYATYRMVLRNVPRSGEFGLKKTNIRFASTVYANGLQLFQDGQVAEANAGFESGNIPQIGFFSGGEGDIEIIVQVANFAYSNSGISGSLYFGEASPMLAAQQQSDAYEFGTFAVLAILALILFISFAASAIYRNTDYSLLLFAFICLLFALFNGLVGERVLLLFLPDMRFELLFKVKDMCSMACFIVLAFYFYRMQKNIISLKFTAAVAVVLGGYMAAVAILPIPVYLKVEPVIIAVYESMIIWFLLRTAVLYIKSADADRQKSLLLFLAVLCMVLYSVDLILFSFSIKNNFRLGQMYIVLFNLIILLLIVLRFFEAYRTVDGMKNRLLRMDKIKDDFLSNTSHELKTPLNAIVNITGSLLKGVEGPMSDKQAHNLSIVMESGRRLSYLVNDLLDYSKMKHGDIALYKGAVDLKATVDSVIGIHLFLLGGKSIEIVNDIPGDFPPVCADSNRLIQILHNLIGNAVKFTHRGKVGVSAAAVGGMAEIRVKDTGIGIAPHMREHIFHPFEQADSSETGGGGTGLGLSIVKKLVELHGGSIHADSDSGQGSVFTFTLPLADTRAATEKRQPDKGGQLRETDFLAAEYPLYEKGDREELILVVDDDYANLQTMINLLKLEGYSYLVADRGQSAFDLIERTPDIDLVLLDIAMPDMSGYEALQRIRAGFSPFELPVLMLTASNKADEIKLSMDNGANDFVGKPFESEELLARVRSLTRLRASVRSARDSEIAFLRSQINPHFLYNTLNAIAELCVDEPGKAEELTLQLSQFLRGSIQFKRLDSLTTLGEELELVKAYVRIEQARFGDILQVRYEVDADPDFRIPPLVLQPLVENAIKHGLLSAIQGGTVSLFAKPGEDGSVRFIVEDNGRGMSGQELENVLRPDANRHGVALRNISRRLKLLYGTGLRIESEEGRGTTISFDIPAEVTGRIGG